LEKFGSKKKNFSNFFFFSNSGSGMCFFFDSYAMPPSFYKLESFIQRTSNFWDYNRQRIQGHSEFCGYYAIIFLLFKARSNEREFFSQFKTNLDYNDKEIQKLITEFS
jgi:hypothetical protein